MIDLEGITDEFGQAVGSLLARRDRIQRKDFQRSLKAYAGLAILNQIKGNQIKEFEKDKSDLESEYKKLIQDNETLYNDELTTQNRRDLRLYQQGGARKEAYLNETVRALFNGSTYAKERNLSYDDTGKLNNPLLQAETNKYLAALKEAEVERMENLKLNPLYTAKSFTEFNEPLIQEFQAKLKAVEDDPTKKSLVKKLLNRYFGYGASEIAELDEAVKEAENKRREQEKLVSRVNDIMSNDFIDYELYYGPNATIDPKNIPAYLESSTYEPDEATRKQVANDVRNRLADNNYNGLELTVFGRYDSENATPYVKDNVLQETNDKANFRLNGKFKILNDKNEVRTGVSADLVIAQDVALIADYLFQNQAKLLETDPYYKAKPSASAFIPDALRYLSSIGRFRAKEGNIYGLKDTYFYKPLEEDSILIQRTKEDAADKIQEFNLLNPAIALSDSDIVKREAKAPRVEDIINYNAFEEKKDLFLRYRELLDLDTPSEQEEEEIIRIENRLDDLNMLSDENNQQAIDREFIRLLLSDELPFSVVKLRSNSGKDYVLDVNKVTKDGKRNFYQEYLDKYGLEKDDLLAILL